jgi:protein-L-isoaspartate(D-aspartate) O-methyltransferase
MCVVMKILCGLLPLPLLAACNGLAGSGLQANDDWAMERNAMVTQQIERRGVHDQRVLQAMRTVPRHEFIPESQRYAAYEDHPLPIGYSQTISQPYIVAAMTEVLKLQPDDTVLEIGTGSGYQAAVLATLVSNVYSIEIVPELAARAEATLKRLGYANVHVRAGDGYKGWPSEAPFDGIIVTCAPDEIPQPLLDQLADGGRLVIPVGGRFGQELVRVTKSGEKFQRENLMGVVFVPMTGEAMGK